MTQAELDIVAMNAMCCMPNKAANLIDLLIINDPSANEETIRFFTLMDITMALFGYNISDGCLTDCQVCDMSQQILAACQDCCTGMNGVPAPVGLPRDGGVPGNDDPPIR